jgi:hypothetical protein
MVADLQERQGIKHLRIHGKGGNLCSCHCIRLPLSTSTSTFTWKRPAMISRTVRLPLFHPLRGRATGAGISADGIYAGMGHYAKAAGI